MSENPLTVEEVEELEKIKEDLEQKMYGIEYNLKAIESIVARLYITARRVGDDRVAEQLLGIATEIRSGIYKLRSLLAILLEYARM